MIIQHIGPLVECQMLDIKKVKLLSERTSGVPTVIFTVAFDHTVAYVLNSYCHES